MPDQNAPASGSTPDAAKVSLPNDRNDIERLESEILSAAERHGYSKTCCFAIRLAVEEAITNAFKHGHAKLDTSVPVSVEYHIEPNKLTVSVQDQGPGFTPTTVPDPTLDENLEIPSGRGLMLIRAYMTEVRHTESGRRLEMTFQKPTTD